MEPTLDLSKEALKILVYLKKNLLGGSLYCSNLADLEYIPAFLLETDFTKDFLPYGTC